MAPSALVAALAPLVPGRTLDPDNPLGELVDTELGDDWLDNLKGALDGPAAELSAAPVFGVRPPSPVQTTNLDRGPALSTDVPPDSRHVRLLEDQVANLHEEMRAYWRWRWKMNGSTTRRVRRSARCAILTRRWRSG